MTGLISVLFRCADKLIARIYVDGALNVTATLWEIRLLFLLNARLSPYVFMRIPYILISLLLVPSEIHNRFLQSCIEFLANA